MGNVLSAGAGQAPARQAARAAELPDSVICTTINKVCSSGMKAIVLGAQQIQLGLADVVVAGGMESMSNVPYLLPKARFGARMGDAKMVDAMVADGLWDPYGDCHMGSYAELCADTHAIERAAQDAHDAWQLAHDPAIPMFAKWYGEEWAHEFAETVLFPGARERLASS